MIAGAQVPVTKSLIFSLSFDQLLFNDVGCSVKSTGKRSQLILSAWVKPQRVRNTPQGFGAFPISRGLRPITFFGHLDTDCSRMPETQVMRRGSELFALGPISVIIIASQFGLIAPNPAFWAGSQSDKRPRIRADRLGGLARRPWRAELAVTRFNAASLYA